MKLTNTVIKKLIKEELVKLQEQGAGCPPGQKWDQAAAGGQGDCVRDPAAPPPPTAIKKSEKADKSKRLGRSMRRGGGAAARTLINRACFGARVTGKAMRAAKKANKCPESRLTYKDWVAGRRAARKNDIDTVEKLIAAAGGSADVGTAEDKAPLEFAQDTAPEQKVQAVMKKFGKNENEAKAIISGDFSETEAAIVGAIKLPYEQAAQIMKDAEELYGELKGAGSGHAVKIMIRNKAHLAFLAKAYEHVLQLKNDTGDGGLAEWLADETSPSVKRWAPLVQKAKGAVAAAAGPQMSDKEKQAALKEDCAEAHPECTGNRYSDDPKCAKYWECTKRQFFADSFEPGEDPEQKWKQVLAGNARGGAVQPGGTDVVKESQTPTFSSFPDQQKLFENWNRYLKKD